MKNQRLDRRAFLAAAGAAGVAVTLPVSGLSQSVPASRIAPPEAPLKLGVASYSLREFPRTRAIEMIRELGIPYVNIKSFHLPYELSSAEIALARREFEAAGLTIVGGGTITFSADTDEAVRAYFDYARDAGMPLIVATADPKILPRIERYAREYGIKVAIHNHGPEDKHYPSPMDVLKHVDRMHPNMGLCLDVGHTVRAGTDVPAAIVAAGARLLDIHMKDLRDLKASDSQVAVGEGAIPVAAIFRQLIASRYQGFVNLEYEINAKDPLPGMKLSFAHMRGVLAGLTVGQPA